MLMSFVASSYQGSASLSTVLVCRHLQFCVLSTQAGAIETKLVLCSRVFSIEITSTMNISTK